MRPRVFVENASPVPIIDEYDFTGVQIGTIDNILLMNPMIGPMHFGSH